LKILLADDEPTIRLSIADALEDAGHTVRTAKDGADAWEVLIDEPIDLVLTDIRMPRMDGITLFRRIRSEYPTVDVILMTAYAEIDDAIAAMKDGALDYLTKPFDVEELMVRIGRLQERRGLEAELEAARTELERRDPSRMIVGDSPSMLRLLSIVETVADSEAPVLITGESGTGKELVARTVHQLSPRRDGPFIAVNCAAFPETLLEAELFGHERGAFTGAHQSREGRFQAAAGGTLFLDEIAEIPSTAQAKLLRVLQDGTFEPLGTNRTVQADVRIVSATHRDLRERLADGRFREDLYYRLNVLDLHIPPLRERRTDLPMLVEHFLQKYTRPGRGVPSLSPPAFAALTEYPFPGNVRELEHAVHRAVVLSRGETIELSHLPEPISGTTEPNLSRAEDAAANGTNGAHGEGLVTLQDAVKAFEREYLMRALKAAEGKKSRAAELLGISRKNLWEKLRSHQIQEP
jgi:two-component system response regulator AtoC